MELSARSQHILGENAVKRAAVFATYGDGWLPDPSHMSRKLDPRSLEALDRFCQYVNGFSQEPTVFFHETGMLELCWVDCQITFWPTHMEVFCLGHFDEDYSFFVPGSECDARYILFINWLRDTKLIS